MRRLLWFLLLLLWSPLTGCTSSSQATGEDGSSYSTEQAEVDYGFASYEHLREHYSKHAYEFGSITQDEYLRRAIALRDAPVSGTVLQIIRADEVRTRFDRASGEFIAFAEDGTILTFFRPGDGKRYFLRQASRPR